MSVAYLIHDEQGIELPEIIEAVFRGPIARDALDDLAIYPNRKRNVFPDNTGRKRNMLSCKGRYITPEAGRVYFADRIA